MLYLNATWKKKEEKMVWSNAIYPTRTDNQTFQKCPPPPKRDQTRPGSAKALHKTTNCLNVFPSSLISLGYQADRFAIKPKTLDLRKSVTCNLVITGWWSICLGSDPSCFVLVHMYGQVSSLPQLPPLVIMMLQHQHFFSLFKGGTKSKLTNEWYTTSGYAD